MQEVADWLGSLPGVTDASPVTLTICGERWPGAVYMKDGSWKYYLVGELPKSVRGPKTCYQFNGDDRDWYISGYLQDAEHLQECQKQYNPFGNHWVLMPWDVPGKIDDYEERPYQRFRVSA